MSNAISVLDGAIFKGAATVKELGLIGMITLRADLASPVVAKAVKAACGQAIPTQRTVHSGAKGSLTWMSPDELLILTNYETADAAVAKLTKAMAAEHHMVANVSDARACFSVTGKPVREVLAKGTPANLLPDAFGPGDFRRSRLGQLPVAFWMVSETEMRVICFRSVGEYVFNWLTTASAKGSIPGHL